jgi:hypothetical protein
MKHRHHIVPKHRGGTDDESNLTRPLTPAQHAMWHFCEWQLHGFHEDYLAWRGLAGFYGKEKIIEELMKEGRRKAGIASAKTTKRLIKEGTFILLQADVQRKAVEASQKTQRALIEQGQHSLQNPEMRARKAKEDSEKQKALWEEGKNPLQQPDVAKRARKSCSMRLSTKNSELFICPHCGKSGRGMANMKRYHFDKCKTLLISPQLTT